MSMTAFFQQVLENPMLLVSTALTLGVILVNGCDLCEHAADVMEHTIMINL